MSSFQSYSNSDARPTVEKVLKNSTDINDIRQRADIKREVVVFRYLNGAPIVNINEIKPLELEQQIEALIYVEQGDSHSIKEARYDRLLELSDQLIDWATATSGSDINSDAYTLTLVGVGRTIEQDGLIATTLTFQSILKLQ